MKHYLVTIVGYNISGKFFTETVIEPRAILAGDVCNIAKLQRWSLY